MVDLVIFNVATVVQPWYSGACGGEAPGSGRCSSGKVRGSSADGRMASFELVHSEAGGLSGTNPNRDVFVTATSQSSKAVLLCQSLQVAGPQS